VFLGIAVNTLYHEYVIFLSVTEGYLVQAGLKANRASSRLFRAATAGEATVSLSCSYEGLGYCK